MDWHRRRVMLQKKSIGQFFSAKRSNVELQIVESQNVKNS
jgi:hypothetical protein